MFPHQGCFGVTNTIRQTLRTFFFTSVCTLDGLVLLTMMDYYISHCVFLPVSDTFAHSPVVLDLVKVKMRVKEMIIICSRRENSSLCRMVAVTHKFKL